jgi:hypothetical protein
MPISKNFESDDVANDFVASVEWKKAAGLEQADRRDESGFLATTNPSTSIIGHLPPIENNRVYACNTVYTRDSSKSEISLVLTNQNLVWNFTYLINDR